MRKSFVGVVTFEHFWDTHVWLKRKRFRRNAWWIRKNGTSKEGWRNENWKTKTDSKEKKPASSSKKDQKGNGEGGEGHQVRVHQHGSRHAAIYVESSQGTLGQSSQGGAVDAAALCRRSRRLTQEMNMLGTKCAKLQEAVEKAEICRVVYEEAKSKVEGLEKEYVSATQRADALAKTLSKFVYQVGQT